MPAAVNRSATQDRPVRWTGAGLIPARGFGYWSVTIPLMLVELNHGGLTVRVRPALFGKLLGAKVLTATAGDGIEALLVRNTAAFQGIEFRPPRRSSFYFFTTRRDAVLAALAAAGFTVSSEPGRERPVWYQPDDD